MAQDLVEKAAGVRPTTIYHLFHFFDRYYFHIRYLS